MMSRMVVEDALVAVYRTGVDVSVWRVDDRAGPIAGAQEVGQVLERGTGTGTALLVRRLVGMCVRVVGHGRTLAGFEVTTGKRMDSTVMINKTGIQGSCQLESRPSGRSGPLR